MLTEADICGALPASQKYARKLTRRVFDAADLIHDTLTHAWAKRARYHGGDANVALYGYAQCLCVRGQTHFRQTARRQLRSVC